MDVRFSSEQQTLHNSAACTAGPERSATRSSREHLEVLHCVERSDDTSERQMLRTTLLGDEPIQ